MQLNGPGAAADDLLGPGDIAGEVGLLTGRPHRLGAVAVEPVGAIAVTQATLAGAVEWLRGQAAAARTAAIPQVRGRARG